jgi:Domain of unknown function (DUF4185)
MHSWRNVRISGAALFAASASLGLCETSAAESNLSVAIAKPSSVVCPVSNPLPEPTTPGALPYLALQYDFHGADLGYSVFDPSGRRMWFLFGDSQAADGVAWYGGGNIGGADATGYVDGPDVFDPVSLCNHLKMPTVTGLVSSFGAGVWSPDMMTASPGDPIGNYVFQGLLSNGSLPAYPTVNSEIPGVDEVTTGAFFHRLERSPAGALYLFYSGSPGFGINYDSSGNPQNPIGLPRPSVSYLSTWRDPSSQAPFGYSPTSFEVLARIDYNLDNSDTTFRPPPKYPTTICPPTPPTGWAATPPLGGNFIQIAPEMGDDGYLYLFGTGTYRESFVYLARLPAENVALIGKCAAPPCYLGRTPGFQIWTTSTPGGPPHWSSASAPPTAADVANASPLLFGDDNMPNYGELSVRHFRVKEDLDLWLLMAVSKNPTFRAQVIARWAPSPTGKWSDALVAFDFSTDPAGLSNQALYCCQGAWTGKSDVDGKLWQCLGPTDGAAAQQCVECRNLSASQSHGTPGLPRYGFYAPYMLPYLSDVSFDHSASDEQRVFSFNVNYLLSEFSPYNALLMQYRLQTTVKREDGGR